VGLSIESVERTIAFGEEVGNAHPTRLGGDVVPWPAHVRLKGGHATRTQRVRDARGVRIATKPLVLVTLAGGGWHLETRRIMERFPTSSARFAYVYGHHSGNHSAARLELPAPGERYPVSYLGPTRRTRFGFLSNAVRFVRSCVSAVALVARLRPDAVLSVGHPAAIPLCLAGKLLGARTVFVESLTRVVELSLTGRIMYHLRLADRLYVQWASLAERYPRSVHAGSVL